MITIFMVAIAVCGFKVQTTFAGETVQSRGLLRDLLEDYIKQINEDTTTTPSPGIFDIFGWNAEDSTTTTTTTTTTTVAPETTTAGSMWGWLNPFGSKSKRRRPIALNNTKIEQTPANDNVQAAGASDTNTAADLESTNVKENDQSILYTAEDSKDKGSTPPNALPANSAIEAESAHEEPQLVPTTEIADVDNIAEHVQENGQHAPSATKNIENKASVEPNALSDDTPIETESGQEELQLVSATKLGGVDNVVGNVQGNNQTTPSATENLENKASAEPKVLSNDTAIETESTHEELQLVSTTELADIDNVVGNVQGIDQSTPSATKNLEDKASVEPNALSDDTPIEMESVQEELQLVSTTELADIDSVGNVQGNDQSTPSATKNLEDKASVEPNALSDDTPIEMESLQEELQLVSTTELADIDNVGNVQGNDQSTPSAIENLEDKASAEPKVLFNDTAIETESASEELQLVSTTELADIVNVVGNVQGNEQSTPSATENLEDKAYAEPKVWSNDTAIETESAHEELQLVSTTELAGIDNAQEIVQRTRVRPDDADDKASAVPTEVPHDVVPNSDFQNNELLQRNLFIYSIESLIEVLNRSISTEKPTAQQSRSSKASGNGIYVPYPYTGLQTTTPKVVCDESVVTKLVKQTAAMVPSFVDNLLGGISKSANTCN